MHWCTNYIGLPYDIGAKKGHNCWSFARLVLKRHFNRDVSEIVYNPHHLFSVAKTIDFQKEQSHWQKIEDGEKKNDGDVVLMTKSDTPIHVGIWLNVDRGGVLHCVDGSGVVFTSRQALNSNFWNIKGVYRHG
ncbi:MAG: NlpC/P60 family protein [Lentisphaeraceae bacterium]|nr:NlpC/P60 family protein [Lentisphaeraceae bacterium]